MLRSDRGFDLESQIAGQRVSTGRYVSVGNPVRVGEPVVSTRRERVSKGNGFVDETWTVLARCASDGEVLREDNLAGVCNVCGQVLCRNCVGRRCSICYSSVCRRHSIEKNGEIRCKSHGLLRRFIKWAILVYVVLKILEFLGS